MSLSPCCNAEYGEYGSMSHSFTACSKCGKSEFSIEIDKLKAELIAAKAEVKNIIGERDGAMKLYSEECDTTMQLEAEIEQLRELIANDSWAISFQTMGQYRTALLKTIEQGEVER